MNTEEKIMEAKEVSHTSCAVLDHIQISKEEVLTVLKHIETRK